MTHPSILLGNGITVAGTNPDPSYENALVVNYNSSGLAQWAQAASAPFSSFAYAMFYESVAVNLLGNVFAVCPGYGNQG